MITRYLTYAQRLRVIRSTRVVHVNPLDKPLPPCQNQHDGYDDAALRRFWRETHYGPRQRRKRR